MCQRSEAAQRLYCPHAVGHLWIPVCVVVGAGVGAVLNRIVAHFVALPVPMPADSRGPEMVCWKGRPDVTLPAVTAVLFGLAGLRFGPSAPLPAFLLLFAALTAATAVDMACARVPDRIVFPALLAALPLLALASLFTQPPGGLAGAAVGGLLYFGLLLMTHLIDPAGLGFGDVKLGLLLGLHLGWLQPQLAVAGYLGAVVLAAATDLGLRLTRRRPGAFPMAPALAGSAVLTVLLSGPPEPGG